MLVRYFHRNDPYSLLGVLLFMLLCALPLLFVPLPFSSQEYYWIAMGKTTTAFPLDTPAFSRLAPITLWVFSFLHSVVGFSAAGFRVLSFLLLVGQMWVFTRLMQKRNLFPNISYIPSFLFGSMLLFSHDMLTFSPALLGSCFLLLALQGVMTEMEFGQFNFMRSLLIGFWIGIASLFDLTYLFYLPVVLLAFVFFTTPSLFKYVTLLVGFAMPHLLLVCLYFGVDLLPWYLENTYQFPMQESDWTFSHLMAHGAVIVVLLSLSLLQLLQSVGYSNYFFQVLGLMFLWVLAGLIPALYFNHFSPHEFISIFPPLAFLSGKIFFDRRKYWIKSSLLVCYTIGIIVSLLYFRFWNKSITTPLKNNSPSGVSIVVLSNQYNLYQNNKPATPLSDFYTSQSIFDEPNVYEHVSLVAHYFLQYKPQIIWDEEKLMTPFMQRIPSLKALYSEKETHWELNKP